MGSTRLPAFLLFLGLGLSAQGQPASGDFLVAARGLADPNFARSVVLLVKHDADGSLGLIINRPTGIPLLRLFPEESGLHRQDGILYAGGPVEAGRFLLLLRAPFRPQESHPVFADVYLGFTRAALRDPRGIPAIRVYAGYAGWAPGQLESEIARADWRLLPAEAAAVFEESPERLWEELTRRLDTPVAVEAPAVLEAPL